MENRHYILIDDQSRIIDGWSDGPGSGKDIAGSILLTEQGGYQFRLYPDGEENPALMDAAGIPLYKWDGAYPVRRTSAEIEADRAALPVPEPVPSDAERIDQLEVQVAEQAAIINALIGGT